MVIKTLEEWLKEPQDTVCRNCGDMLAVHPFTQVAMIGTLGTDGTVTAGDVGLLPACPDRFFKGERG